MTDFTREVIQIIQKIPYGKVMTYGQIALMAGNPWGARQVVRILNSQSRQYHLPWHWVINSKGKISLPGDGGREQRDKLMEEGVLVIDGQIDLDQYLSLDRQDP